MVGAGSGRAAAIAAARAALSISFWSWVISACCWAIPPWMLALSEDSVARAAFCRRIVADRSASAARARSPASFAREAASASARAMSSRNWILSLRSEIDVAPSTAARVEPEVSYAAATRWSRSAWAAAAAALAASALAWAARRSSSDLARAAEAWSYRSTSSESWSFSDASFALAALRSAWVGAADSGAAGLARLGQRRYHLLILDAELPQEDGWDVLRAVRKDPELAGLKVIVLMAAKGETGMLVLVPVDKELRRPFTMGTLL